MNGDIYEDWMDSHENPQHLQRLQHHLQQQQKQQQEQQQQA
jgi:hypothetical protein